MVILVELSYCHRLKQPRRQFEDQRFHFPVLQPSVRYRFHLLKNRHQLIRPEYELMCVCVCVCVCESVGMFKGVCVCLCVCVEVYI